MIEEIVAEALRERHAGGMRSSAKQEKIAASERSFTGHYLKETLAKAPVRAPTQTGVQAKRKARRKVAAEADQPDLIAAK